MSALAEQTGQDISNEDYHAMPGVSNSRLKDFMEDPRVYWYKYLSGKYYPKRMDHFDFGTAVHSLCLEGDNSNIVVIPESVLSKSGSRAGGAWKEFAEANAGKELLKQHDYNAVLRCVDAVKRHPVAASLLSANGFVERSFTYRDPQFELLLRCRPDKIATLPERTIVVDLKTTSSGTTAPKFVKTVANYGYFYQEYFYRRVLAQHGIEPSSFVFVVVNVEEPHTVDCYTLDAEFLRLAQDDVENALFALAERTRANDWQVASNSIVELSPPNYLKYKGEYQL